MMTFTFLIKIKRGTSYWHLKVIGEILNLVHKFIGDGIEQDRTGHSPVTEEGTK